MRGGAIVRVVLGCVLLAVLTAFGQTTGSVEILIATSTGQPLSDARITVKRGDVEVFTTSSDEKGRVAFAVQPGRYGVVVEKTGFEPFRNDDLEVVSGGASTIELTLTPSLAQHEHVEVTAKAEPVEQGATVANSTSGEAVKNLPSRPETVTAALPLIPGVVRTPAGDVEISGTGQHRSALIVNSADVTDPATGQFGLTVPIDSVQSLSVFQTPFLAEYGRFTSGLVSVETRRGGEQWKWEINDPFPDFRIYSWHLRGVRDATPRLNIEGPLIAHKLYFSEGLEYEARNSEVHVLPYPKNLTRKQGVNSFAQLDWVASARHLVTGTVHVAPQRLGFFGLDYFNPQPVTPDASTHNYTGTLGDRLTLWGGMLENTFSVTRFDARVWGQGIAPMVITPGGNVGNYFAGRDRDASRYAWSPAYTVRPWNALGTHVFKLGVSIARTRSEGELSERPIEIRDAMGALTERAAFIGGHPFAMTDTEMAYFAQDHWSISSRVAADLGLRTESQVISQSFRMAPRAGIAWVPFSSSGTVVRAGFGLFYDRVPLNVYSFNHSPRRIVTYYDAAGAIAAGPYFFDNVLEQVDVHSRWVRHKQVPGDFSPRSATGSIAIEQNLGQAFKLRAGYMENVSSGLVTMQTIEPDPDTRVGAYQLSGAGRSRYRQFELTARLRSSEKREFIFSYVRSRARGDINDFNNFVGTFPGAVIRPNYYSALPADLPNRFLAWGTLALSHGFMISPILEYRNGFPYSVLDAGQNYAGIPNANRYRNFLSLDSRFSKDLKLNPKYTVRVSLVTYNLTNHFNPEAVHNNLGDPAYGIFFGGRGRRHTADFDVLF